MVRRSDPRPDRSRRALGAALLELLETRSLAQITAADVATAAGVSRSTFYDHFPDLRALATAACTERFDALLSATPSGPLEGRADLIGRLTAFFRHIRADRQLYGALLGAKGDSFVAAHLQKRITEGIWLSRSVSGPGLDTRASFLAGGLVGAATAWLDEGCVTPPSRIAAEIAATVAGAAAHVEGRPGAGV